MCVKTRWPTGSGILFARIGLHIFGSFLFSVSLRKPCGHILGCGMM